MSGFVYVALGGGLGAVLRHGCAVIAAELVPLPGLWATAFVNLAGSFAMGLIVGWWTHASAPSGEGLRLFLTVGLLGGFTTYSAFAMETSRLMAAGSLGFAAAYAIGTVVVCVGAYILGAAMMMRVVS